MRIAVSEAPWFYDDSKDILSEHGGKVCRESFDNSPFVSVMEGSEHFRAPRSYKIMRAPINYRHTIGSDGIGTKVVFWDAIQKYGTLSRDLVAMWADDVVREGGLPLALSNVADINGIRNTQEEWYFKELLDWLWEVAQEQNLVIMSWETASLWNCVWSPNPNAALPFNWSATFHGITHEKLNITWEDIQAWDKIVVLEEKGFRSNGWSIFRRAFESKYWNNWYEHAPRQEIMDILTPSRVYARAIAEVNGWYNWENDHEKLVDMKWIAHLSGGSFDDKLFKAFLEKKWLSAELDNLFQMPSIVKKWVSWALEAGQDLQHPAEVYKALSCWNGMAVIIRGNEQVDTFISIMEEYGINAQVAWEITNTPKWSNPDLFIDSPDLDDIY